MKTLVDNYKTYVLMVAKTFQKDHTLAGIPTGFSKGILSGDKIHTLRSNYDRWKMIVDEVNAGNAILSVREWSDKPYRSKHHYITDFRELGIERIAVIPDLKKIVVHDEHQVLRYLDERRFAWNDGLMQDDFWEWFPKFQKNLPLIHFTDFRYMN